MPVSNDRYVLPSGAVERDGNVLNAADLNDPRNDYVEGINEAFQRFGGVKANNPADARRLLGITTSAGVRNVSASTTLTVDDLRKTITVNASTATVITLPVISTLSLTDNTETFITVRNLSQNDVTVVSQSPDSIANPNSDGDTDHVKLSRRGQTQRFIPRTRIWYQEYPETAPVFQDSDSVWPSNSSVLRDDTYIGVVQETTETNPAANVRTSYRMSTNEFASDIINRRIEFGPYGRDTLVNSINLQPSPATKIADYGMIISDNRNQSWDSRDLITNNPFIPSNNDRYRYTAFMQKRGITDGNGVLTHHHLYVKLHPNAGYINISTGNFVPFMQGVHTGIVWYTTA